MASLYEYYNTGDNIYDYVYEGVWRAQTFTPATAHEITSVKLLLYRVGSPGTVTVSIQGVDGSNHPDMSDLCSGTTNGDTLTTNTAGEWREITFSAGYALATITKYATVARAPNGNLNNHLRWRCDNSSPTYAGGCYEYSNDSGSTWASLAAIDFMFEDWGEAITITAQATGGATMSIAGSLLKQISKVTGGSLASAGGVHYYMVGGWKKLVGGASLASAGGIAKDFVGAFKRAMGGAVMSIAGSLARRVLYNTGRMSITMKFPSRAKTMRFNTRGLTMKLHKRSKITRLRM